MKKMLLRSLLVTLLFVASGATPVFAGQGSFPTPICAPGDAGCPS